MNFALKDLFLLHLISCAFMTGLIWVIQVLHYPAFELITKEHFLAFHNRHTRNITWIVGPLMLTELVTAIAMALQISHYTLTLNFILLVGTWISTGLLSVPLHKKLSTSQDSQTIRRLVKTNWPRTLLWSLRLILLFTYARHH